MTRKLTNIQEDVKINKHEGYYSTKKRGKWSVAGIPHKGWKCSYVEDLGEPMIKCQMCESNMIRYVYHMTHEDFPEVLHVGGVCAGYMEDDPETAWRRDRELKRQIARPKRWTSQYLEFMIKNRHLLREQWLSMVWRTSEKGNLYISDSGYRIIIQQRFGRWTFIVADEQNDSFVYNSKNKFPTLDEAKLAAYDHITSILIEIRDSISKLRKN
ncbi:hypothetical protein ACJ77P_12310 [Syntrophus buswellii]|uniref:hypothetical protein n=1 Tax=Syntrophus buswellii TaxID=43774 RepID=UPI0038D3549E